MLELTINQFQHLLPWQVNLVSIYKWASKPDFGACEQQRRRPACASAQSNQDLCYSVPATCTCKILIVQLVSVAEHAGFRHVSVLLGLNAFLLS